MTSRAAGRETDPVRQQPDGELDFELRDMAGHLIRISQQVHAAIWNSTVGSELTSPQFAVLHALAHEEPLDQRALGARASLDRSTLADIAARLNARDLIVRVEDPNDRRRKLVRLTADGRIAHRRAVQQANQVNELLLEGLAPGERAALTSILNALVEQHHGILEHHE